MENTTPCEADRPALVIDLTSAGIPAGDLEIALANAKLDPDGQVYPWRDLYPLPGGAVVYDGQLWTVARKEPGPDHDLQMVGLEGQGHDNSRTVCRYELRPVTWTALDEIELEVTRAMVSPEQLRAVLS